MKNYDLSWTMWPAEIFHWWLLKIQGRCPLPRTGFIIKHNLRRESVTGWLATAKEHAPKVENFTTSREKAGSTGAS